MDCPGLEAIEIDDDLFLAFFFLCLLRVLFFVSPPLLLPIFFLAVIVLFLFDNARSAEVDLHGLALSRIDVRCSGERVPFDLEVEFECRPIRSAVELECSSRGVKGTAEIKISHDRCDRPFHPASVLGQDECDRDGSDPHGCLAVPCSGGPGSGRRIPLLLILLLVLLSCIVVLTFFIARGEPWQFEVLFERNRHQDFGLVVDPGAIEIAFGRYEVPAARVHQPVPFAVKGCGAVGVKAARDLRARFRRIRFFGVVEINRVEFRRIARARPCDPPRVLRERDPHWIRSLRVSIQPDCRAILELHHVDIARFVLNDDRLRIG